MDESSFEIDSTQLAEASRRFPAHRLSTPHPRVEADLSYLASADGEFGRHAWDEGGHH